MSFRVSFVRAFAAPFLLAVASASDCPCLGQVAEGDLVYKFKVVGMEDPAAAKPAQAALLAHGDARACYFVDEDDVFSLVMLQAITRQEIAARLASAGFVLTGAVLVSDGTVLHAPAPLVSDE